MAVLPMIWPYPSFSIMTTMTWGGPGAGVGGAGAVGAWPRAGAVAALVFAGWLRCGAGAVVPVTAGAEDVGAVAATVVTGAVSGAVVVAPTVWGTVRVALSGVARRPVVEVAPGMNTETTATATAAANPETARALRPPPWRAWRGPWLCAPAHRAGGAPAPDVLRLAAGHGAHPRTALAAVSKGRRSTRSGRARSAPAPRVGPMGWRRWRCWREGR